MGSRPAEGHVRTEGLRSGPLEIFQPRAPVERTFQGAQKAGVTAGVIYSPEEVMEDEHFTARGFRVEVEHPERGQSFVYPGAPYRFERSPWRISRRAPRLGEHNDAVLGPLSEAGAG